MAPQFKKLTDCPENLREAIDWLIQIKNGKTDGIKNLSAALQKFITDAIWVTQDGINSRKEKAEKTYDIAEKLSMLNKLGEQEQSFDKLQESLTPLLENLQITSNHPEKNILTELCAGLETFIGYESGNYSGSGIVYGDCDRLRDAVLRFLRGVLESVKGEDAVEKYVVNVDDIIKCLNKKIGNGHAGFISAITSVESTLSMWNNMLTQRTNEFRKQLGELKNKYIDDYTQNIASLKSNGCVAMHTSFMQSIVRLKAFMSHLRENERGYKTLDSGLKDKLNAPLEKVDDGIKILQNATQDDDFIKAVYVVQSTFAKLPDEIESFISENVKSTISGHQNAVGVLKESVKREVEKSRDAFLTERLAVFKEDLVKAITTFSKNAYNLGGLKNKTVRQAIEAIEMRLKRVDDNVTDEGSLSGENVTRQIQTIIGEVNEDKALQEIIHNIKQLNKTIGDPKTVFGNNNERMLQELVEKAREDLEKALDCAKENAKNLGGLQNNTVEKAISKIQAKLHNEANTITTMLQLSNLKVYFMEGEIRSIAQKINHSGIAVKDSLRGALDKIEEPGNIFNEKHKPALTNLAGNAQNYLENVIQKTRECINTHGGANNQTVKKVIEVIQKKLYTVDSGNDEVNSLDKLKKLAQDPVEKQIKTITDSPNKNQNAASDIIKLDALFRQIGTPDVIYANKHQVSLKRMALDTEEALKQAIDNAIKYVESSRGSLRGKIMGAFKNVIQSSTSARQKDSQEMAEQVVKNLKTLNTFSSTFNDKGNAVENALSSFVGAAGSLTSIFEERIRELSDDSQIKPWINQYISYMFTVSLKSAHEAFTKVDDEYQKNVLQQLKQVRSTISGLDTKAESDELKNFHINLIPFDIITKAINSNSVYEEDKAARNKYFENLMNFINRTVDTLNTAYQKAYQSAAKSYLSRSIDQIQKAVGEAEGKYKFDVERLMHQIEGAVSKLGSAADKDNLEAFPATIKQFDSIQSIITKESVFSDDVTQRQHFFVNLENVIKNTAATLHEAYKNAYKSSAKSYLSGAIRTIREEVGKAEKQYESAVNQNVEEIKEKVAELKDSNFTTKANRDRLAQLFDAPFEALRNSVLTNSAFDDDYKSRKQCFEKLHALIKDTLATLTEAYKEAYKCSAKTYLSDAIYMIKREVVEAEKKYKSAVAGAVLEIGNMIVGLKENAFINKKGHSAIKSLFDAPFKLLQFTVLEYSAFKKDLDNRKICFSKLHHLIEHMVQTLIEAYELFDRCAMKAIDHLHQSFDDAENRINKLGVDVKDEVKTAFDKVIAEVYDMYLKDKTAQLKSLSTCVEEQRKEVERIIGVDLKKGVKGLLQLLKMWLDKKSGDLKSAQNLKSLADLFKHLNKHLHRYVKFQHDGLEVEDDSDDDGDDDSLSSTPAVRQVPPPISGGGYRARPAVQSVSSKDPNAPQPAGRAGYSGKVRTPSTGQQFLSPQLTKDPISDYFDRLDHHTRGLFGTLSAGYFSKSFASKREEFVQFLELMSPFNFGRHCDPLLCILKTGLQSFLRELGKAYISTYCGAAYVFKWEFNGEKCAKVCLTMLEILFHDLDGLRNKVNSKGEWNDKHICLYDIANNKKTDNPLGAWFQHRGFTVSHDKDTQNGELSRIKTGADIITRLVGDGTKVGHKLYAEPDKTDGALQDLHEHLETYYRVCHHRLIPDARAPTTIYEMLHWLGGLWYNPVFGPLKESLKKLFNNVATEYKIGEGKFTVALPYRRSVSMKRDLNGDELTYVFGNSTIRANLLLIAIQGHGQADGRYACDFLTNPDGLLYPSNPDQCLDLLVEVCLRVNHQIRFLYKQCHNGPDCGGWRDCLYGRGIGGSRWQCNTLQCSNQECDQKCRQHYSCGVKSPLQLFLEDGLPGFLPHPFEKPDCKITCSLANHNGIPCKTPMGFRDLSIRASHQQKGERIKKVLDWFCGTENESLNLLCSYLLLLLRRPPQTLCDMFAFYYNFLDHYDENKGEQKKHRREAFNDAVTRANLGRSFNALNPSTILCTSKHVSSDGKPTHEKGDLFSLLSCNPEDSPTMPCGRYLQSIGDDIRLLYYGEHASLYLSWIIYQAETFYNWLIDLCDKCCKKCTSPKSICYGTRCARDCQVKSVYEANKSDDHKADLKALDGKNHSDDCTSIVNCSNTHSILYTYGFTFGSPFDLGGGNNNMSKKRTCQDFCRALENVLNKEKQVEAPLAKLVFHIIPEYLWQIRQPFSYLLLTLWLLSLFYLIHIMVIRLDLLHVKSHLHSPSSHRIAAQSLLAAARVNKLAKLTYLQP